MHSRNTYKQLLRSKLASENSVRLGLLLYVQKEHLPESEVIMVQRVQVAERIEYLSNQELSEIIIICEKAISNGSAEIEDYEAFVICQQELAKRTWS